MFAVLITICGPVELLLHNYMKTKQAASNDFSSSVLHLLKISQDLYIRLLGKTCLSVSSSNTLSLSLSLSLSQRAVEEGGVKMM
jgi:hypothetical protein